MAIENILEKINKSALSLLEPLSLERTFAVIVEEATQILEIKYGTIFLVRNGKLHDVFRNIGDLAHISPRKNGYTYRALKTKKVFVVPVAQLRSGHPELEKVGIKTSLFLPLTYRHQTLGVLNLHSTKDEDFSQEDITFLQLFSSMSTLAIRKAELYAEVKNALATRDEFMALSAHEIKTPLTAIIGYLQLLKRHDANFDDQQHKWLEQVETSTTRLTSLVSGLLEANQMRAGKFEILLKESDLAVIIDNSVTEIRQKYPHRQLQLDLSLPKPWIVIADPKELKKAFWQLLDNAFKFSSDTSTVFLKLKATKTKWQITITDQGQGISVEDKKKIQDGFHKAQPNTKEGLGIGLFVSNSIIAAHRGELKITSKVGKGTTVTISLPKVRL